VNILVAGGFDPEHPEQAQDIREFCSALGAEVAEKGHVLLNGSRTELDAMVATGAYERLEELDDPNRDKRVISYVLSGIDPIHRRGTIIRSRLADWEIARETFYIPEQVRDADAVILVGGFQGTYRAANWARIAKKPLLPFTAFGGAAAKIYEQELNDFEMKYEGLVTRLEYAELNSVKNDWNEHAANLVALAEKIAESRSVLVVMSYSGRADLEDAFDSFRQVCQELGYECDRVSEESAGERILPDILARLERAAFAIVDLTELRPNVFYELGYADGLRKKVVVTAKAGTELPFDVKDIPTIFWDGQRKLREDLTKRIEAVVKTGIGAAADPIR
jgi:predicted Rossmann-fold nucleotide-binding protein